MEKCNESGRQCTLESVQKQVAAGVGYTPHLTITPFSGLTN